MKKFRSKPFVIGISGGSGSGKSTIINEIVEHLGTKKIAVLHHDAYYRHRPELSFEERTKINFDHPDSYDTHLLMKHLLKLITGVSVEVPIYDFTQHLRDSKTKHIPPRQILIIEGILVLSDPQLCEIMDLKIFVDVPSDLRFIRRLDRDISERGRSFTSVTEQYIETVRPMYKKFVEPSKQKADILIPGGGQNMQAVKLLSALIQTLPAN